jgi:hypothetical protein
MTDPFLGSQALALGALTPYEMRSRYVPSPKTTPTMSSAALVKHALPERNHTAKIQARNRSRVTLAG